jgi:hypothetical protein
LEHIQKWKAPLDAQLIETAINLIWNWAISAANSATSELAHLINHKIDSCNTTPQAGQT